MKILVLNGSPKSGRSNTLKLTELFLKHIKDNPEFDIEYIDLSKVEIKHCIGCLSCWTKTPGKCVLKDDMAELLSKYIKSDLILWSIPLYFYGMPSKTKAFCDRLLPLELPFMKLSPDGGTEHLKRFDLSKQKHLLISTCGFPTKEKNYEPLLKQFEIMTNDNFKSLLFPEGEVLRVPELKEKLQPYFKFISNVGKEYFESGDFSEESKQKLSNPIIPPQIFVEMANQSWDIAEG